MENQAQNSQYTKQRLMVLRQERIKILITKMQKKYKKHNKSETSTHSHLKEEIEGSRKEEREGSPVPIFPPPKFRNCEIVEWLNGFLL